MVINRYEESQIKNDKLPIEWQSQTCLDELEDFLQQNWEQRAVFYDDSKADSRQQFLGFTGQRGIRTKNYIGTIVFKGDQLNIYPKVFRSEGDDQDINDLSQAHLMKNLVIWLEYCNRMAYPFINISTELNDAEDLKELFVSLYVGYVRHAIGRGLYYEYVEETDDISCIKGSFNVKDYFLNKVPNGQAEKFRCTYSDFVFDNGVNQIIKYTCKILLNNSSSRNQKAIRNILIKLNEVEDIPCKPSDCDKIRLSKLQRHYRVIISMSKMFLLNKTSTFFVDMNESFCFLFPTELLFEGFVGGFIKELIGNIGGSVYLQKSDMSLIDEVHIGDKVYGGAFTMRHDILVELKGKSFILDTKYKQIERFDDDFENARRVVTEEPNQTDVYQVCEYARKRGLSDVYLLYPQYRYEEPDNIKPMGISSSYGNGRDIRIHFVRLPFVFEDNENMIKERLKDTILDLICSEYKEFAEGSEQESDT